MAARVVELVNMFAENVRTLRDRDTNNHDNGLRRENDARTNEHGIIVIENRSVLSLIILLLLLAYILFLYIGSYILNKSQPYLETVDVQDMHANFKIHNDTVSLEEVRTSLRVDFGQTHKVKVYPKFSTYTIRKKVYDSLFIRAVSKAPYAISECEQLLVVNFKPSQIRVQEEQLKAFEQRLDQGKIWMRIDGDFKMLLRLARFIPFPQTSRHIYFVCNVLFKAVPLEEIVDKRCEIFYEPQK